MIRNCLANCQINSGRWIHDSRLKFGVFHPIINRMKTKLLCFGAILFWILVSKTNDLLFAFFAVYLTALWLSVLFFKREQKQVAKSTVTHPSTRRDAKRAKNR